MRQGLEKPMRCWTPLASAGWRGVDVVVAYVETHGRPETEALLEGLRSSLAAGLNIGGSF